MGHGASFSRMPVGFAFLRTFGQRCHKITHLMFCIDAREEGRNIDRI